MGSFYLCAHELWNIVIFGNSLWEKYIQKTQLQFVKTYSFGIFYIKFQIGCDNSENYVFESHQNNFFFLSKM